MSNPSKKLKWGILGTGRICNKVVPAIQNAPSSVAHAIASRTQEKAKEAAKKFNITHAMGSYESLIANKEIEVVYVPLPNAMHVEWVIKAAQAKKHILCEKPLGINFEEVQHALKAAKENNVHLMEGYMWPHHPRTAKLKEILKSGRLGELKHINAALDFLLTDQYSRTRRTPELGGGALYDTGCYPVQGILWAFEEMPSSVFAQAQFENGIDTEMTALLKFSSGKSATFHCSFNNTYRGHLEVIGTKAVLRVPLMWNPFLNANAEIWENGELKETLTFGRVDQVLQTVENFNQLILNGKSLPFGTSSTESIANVIDALYESAWTEELIRL